MKIYRNIYSWQAIDEIKAGNRVYVLDREDKTVECVNDMAVHNFSQIQIYGNAKKNRFDFWVEEIVEEVADV